MTDAMWEKTKEEHFQASFLHGFGLQDIRWAEIQPPPSYRKGDQVVSIFPLSPKAATHVHGLLRYPFMITVPMIRWLMKLPNDFLEPHREEVIEVMWRSGLSWFLPVDYRRRVRETHPDL